MCRSKKQYIKILGFIPFFENLEVKSIFSVVCKLYIISILLIIYFRVELFGMLFIWKFYYPPFEPDLYLLYNHFYMIKTGVLWGRL